MLPKRKPKAPLYSSLSNLILVLDATGLRYNTTNAYGTVDSSGVCTVWQGVAPGSHTGLFTAGGLGPGNTGSPCKWLDGFLSFSGGVVLSSTSAASSFNFLSDPSTTKWTAHLVLKIGKEANPELIYGLFGNNQSSQGSKGASIFYDDRTTATNSNSLGSVITKGTAGFIIEARPDDIITPNVPFVLTVETDLTLAAASRQKFYINGVQFPFTVLSPSTATVTTPSFVLQIGSVGNNLFPFNGWYSHIILQNTVESSGTMLAFVNSLLPYTRNKGQSFWTVDESIPYAQTTFLSESIYYLNVAVEKNPVSGNILCVFGQWTSAGHTWADGNVYMFRKSTGDISIFGTKATAFDPGANRGIIDGGFFYDSTGRGHGFTNTMDGTGTTSTPLTSKVFYFYTDDDGTNWNSSEITPPSDGLEFTACYGNGYEANGFNWFCVYRQTEDTTSSARYILKWAVGANISTIQWILVESGSTYINEGSIAYLGGDSHVLVCRNESTLEWTQYYTNDNWATNTNQGDLTFGETNTTAGPLRIVKFPVYRNGIRTDILKCYYPLRGTAVLKAIYALPANIISSGLTGWDLDTKEIIVDDTEIIHYGGAYHDGFNFFAVYTREVVASVTSTLISFRGPTNLHAKVLTELGL